MTDLKRDMAILATSGRDWAARPNRMAARVPETDIFSQRLITREHGGWKMTEYSRAVLASMEAKPVPNVSQVLAECIHESLPPLPQLYARANRRRQRRERRCAARERARASAS